MPGLVIIDEKGGVVKSGTGFPHSTILLHYDQFRSLKWFGFFPNGQLYGNRGYVDVTVREEWMQNYIRYEVAESKLNEIVNKVVPTYQNKDYNLGVCDCVSFAADACRAADISVPLVNVTPGGFVMWLRRVGPNYTHYNDKPYPWKVGSASPYAPAVADREKYIATVIVEHGMTLGNLCKKIYTGLTGAKLSERINLVAELNNIPNPNHIHVGQKIRFPKIPVKKGTP